MVEETKPIYIPALKWRKGEKLALKNLSNQLKGSIIPLIELVNDEGDNPEDLSNDLSKFWNRTAYLDVRHRPKNSARRALDNVVYNTQNIDIIPVTSLDSPQIVMEGIKDVVGIYNNGLALRVVISQDLDFSLLVKEVSFILEYFVITKDKIDLIIDFGYLKGKQQIYQTVLEDIANSISLDNWRNVIVTAGSFPSDLEEFQPNGDNILKRTELELWKKNRTMHGRDIVYSDYTTRHPDNITKGLRGSKSVRYTLENDFQILRGRRDDKPFKYLVHAMNIKMLYSDIYPKSYCWGDEAITEKANQLEECLNSGIDPETYEKFSTGSPTDWVAWSVNHHITVVLKSNLQA